MVSNILYFHPYLGKWSKLTNIFQMGWFNHQPALYVPQEPARNKKPPGKKDRGTLALECSHQERTRLKPPNNTQGTKPQRDHQQTMQPPTKEKNTQKTHPATHSKFAPENWCLKDDSCPFEMHLIIFELWTGRFAGRVTKKKHPLPLQAHVAAKGGTYSAAWWLRSGISGRNWLGGWSALFSLRVK